MEYLVFVIIVFGIYKFLNSLIRGILGEFKVRLKLFMLPSDKYKVLNDVLLKTKRGTTQIDHIVVSIYGIFVIETKNYKGKIIGNGNDKDWIKEIHGNKYPFRNPIIQNKGHIRALAKNLKIDESVMTSMVVFLNDCKLNIKTISLVFHIDRLLPIIRNKKNILLSESQVKSITDMIKKLNQKGLLAKINHIMYVKKREKREKRIKAN